MKAPPSSAYRSRIENAVRSSTLVPKYIAPRAIVGVFMAPASLLEHAPGQAASSRDLRIRVPTQLLDRHTCVPQATQESGHPESAVAVHTPPTSAALGRRSTAQRRNTAGTK